MKIRKLSNRFSETANLDDLSAANALRHLLRNRLTPVLLASGNIENRELREQIETECTEMVRVLEQVIEQYQLESCDRSESNERAA